MNNHAVLGYQDMLFARIGQLVSQLEKREGSEVDLASWLSCFSYAFLSALDLFFLLTTVSCSFDFMGDLALVVRILGIAQFIEFYIDSVGHSDY
jgi:hypothetical protein